MTGARLWGCRAAFFVLLLVLSSAGVAAAAEVVAAALPADRIVVSAEAGGGWTQAGFRYGGTNAVVSAPAFDAKAMVGYRAGDLDVGFVAGGLLTSSFNGDSMRGQPASRSPDSLRLVHAGGFLTWQVARARGLSVGGRVEAAYGWLPGMAVFNPGLAALATLRTATAHGGIGALDASYELLSSPRLSVVVGAELFAGALWGDLNAAPVRVLPRGGAASVGVRWP